VTPRGPKKRRKRPPKKRTKRPHSLSQLTEIGLPCRAADPIRPKKGETILSRARDAWHEASGYCRNLSIPTWYPGLLGVPNWILRQKPATLTERQSALALIVRMNFLMDFPPKGLVGHGCRKFCLPRRRFFFCRSPEIPPVYDYQTGSYPLLEGARRINTSYALSLTYEWWSTLSCTLRNFVHLLALKRAHSHSQEFCGSRFRCL